MSRKPAKLIDTKWSMWMPVSCSRAFSVQATPRSVWLPSRFPRANASLILNVVGDDIWPLPILQAGMFTHESRGIDITSAHFRSADDVQDHQRVRLGGGEPLAEAAALADPGVRADDHDVLGLRVQVHRLVAQFAGDVHLVQVAVQVPVDRVGAAEGDQQHHGDAAGRPGQDLLRPAGVRPAAIWSGRASRRAVPGRVPGVPGRVPGRLPGVPGRLPGAPGRLPGAPGRVPGRAAARCGVTRGRAPVVRWRPILRIRLVHVGGPHSSHPIPTSGGGLVRRPIAQTTIAERYIPERKPSHPAQRANPADSFPSRLPTHSRANSPHGQDNSR